MYDKLSKEDITWNAGLSLKSTSNIHKSATKSIVIKTSEEDYDKLVLLKMRLMNVCTDERGKFGSQYRKSTDVVASLCKCEDRIV